MPAIRKDSAEISLAELVAQMPDGCRARREYVHIFIVLNNCDGALRDYVEQLEKRGGIMGFGHMCIRDIKFLKDCAAYKEAVK